MTRDLITVTSETPLKEAEELMSANKINCLPVVEGKKLIGIITTNDL